MVDTERSGDDDAAPTNPAGAVGSGSMRSGLDREYESMGTGEAGGGVGGGGASSSDVEWDAADGPDTAAAGEFAPEETSGGAMTDEQEFEDGSGA